MTPIPADYHMHTRFSPDGHFSPREMCQAALGKGLAEIAVTDHFECFHDNARADARYTPEILAACFQALDACREEFAGRLTIRKGVEIGQPQVNPPAASALMSALPFDYVIGSVHKLNDMDLGEMDYPPEAIPDRVRKNLAMLYELADRQDYDCLGHLELIKRYASFHGQKIDLMDYREELEPILRRAIERGKGIEVNTSGLRTPAKETLPSLAVLKFYRSLGGEIVTVGSDAHYTKDVAAGFGTARQLLLEAGFRRLTTFENRRPHFLPLD